MATFLYDLEQLGEEHSEIYDTAVRERMWTLVEKILIKQSGPVDVPDDLGMFS